MSPRHQFIHHVLGGSQWQAPFRHAQSGDFHECPLTRGVLTPADLTPISGGWWGQVQHLNPTTDVGDKSLSPKANPGVLPPRFPGRVGGKEIQRGFICMFPGRSTGRDQPSWRELQGWQDSLRSLQLAPGRMSICRVGSGWRGAAKESSPSLRSRILGQILDLVTPRPSSVCPSFPEHLGLLVRGALGVDVHQESGTGRS